MRNAQSEREGVKMESLLQYKGVDWAAMVFAVFSLYYISKHRKCGFVFGIGCSVCWLIFGILAHSIPSIIANAIYVVFQIKGWRDWKEDQGVCPT